MNQNHIGSTLDSLLEDEGILEDVTHRASLRVITWQLKQQMKAQNVSKSELARRMHTSRSQVARLIDGEDDDVRVSTLQKAAHALKRELVIELAEASRS